MSCFIIFRCQLRDKEVNAREKDSVVTELKEKVVRLTGLVRQLEAKVAERDQELKVRYFFLLFSSVI